MSKFRARAAAAAGAEQRFATALYLLAAGVALRRLTGVPFRNQSHVFRTRNADRSMAVGGKRLEANEIVIFALIRSNT